MPRRGPLHTCGISMIEILGKASTKTKNFNGPIGSMMKRVFILVTTLLPFIYALQDQWLAILSFADDRILAVVSTVETLFPPSTRLFNKIDKLVHVAESLPGKFDDAMNKFPVIMHKVPFIDWTLAHVISWINFWIIALTQWGSDNMKEKEIRIDKSCDNPGNEIVPPEKPYCSVETTNIIQSENSSQDETSSNTECTKIENRSSLFDSSEEEAEETEKRSKNVNLNSKMSGRRRSYKEILETGTKESLVKKDNDVPRVIPPKPTGSKKKDAKDDSLLKHIPPKATTGSEKKDEKGEEEDEDEDKSQPKDRDILELFDAGWHLSPPSKRTMSAPMLL
ncbi:hypothetical protein LguiB_024644 [Lonicera macranthoides]